MKKFFVCAAIFAAMLFIVCCGDDGGDGGSDGGQNSLEGQKCYMNDGEDLYSCEENGTVVMVLHCEEGKWKRHKQCSAGQVCNSDTGNCDIPGDNGGDNNEEQPATNCGNGFKDEGEVCDGGAQECKVLDASFGGGFAYCKPDCSGYDTTPCTAGGNGGGNGGGDNGGGTSGKSCPDMANCAFQCQDQSCLNGCMEGAASQTEANNFVTYYNCLANNQCTQANCEQCSNEYNTCMNGGGGNGGGGDTSAITTCSAFAQCFFSCQDQSCADACSNRLQSEDAYNNFVSLYNCLKNSGCQQVNCEQCSNEYNTCMSN